MKDCGVGALAALGVGAAYAPNFTVTEVHTEADKSRAETGRVIAGASLGAGAVLAGLAGFFFWREGRATSATVSQLPLPPPQLGHAPVAFAAAP